MLERAHERLRLNSRKPTAVADHIIKCPECIDSLENGSLKADTTNFEIIHSCTSKLGCEVREAFLIKELKPTLNRQLYQSGASLTLKVFG